MDVCKVISVVLLADTSHCHVSLTVVQRAVFSVMVVPMLEFADTTRLASLVELFVRVMSQ